MISEGVHIKGVNTLIMLRRTESVNLFNQQLGRCLDANSKEQAILFDLVNNKYSVRVVQNKISVKTNSIFDVKKINVTPSKQMIVHDYTKDIVDVLEEIKMNLEGRWTKEEDELLINFYKQNPDSEGLKEFIIKNFKNRSYLAVKARAHVLNLTAGNSRLWSEEEDEILKQYYPIEGAKCCSRLQDRTMNSVMQRANKLGIAYTENSWSDEELEIIRIYYPKEGKNIVNRLPHKTIYAIKAQARKMKVYSKAFCSWSEEEDKIIKEKYAELGGSKLQQLIPNKTCYEINKRAQALGVKKENKKIKIKCIELDEIFDNAKEAAKLLHLVSPNANKVILECCKGRKKTAYGYHWECVE
jgi:hypothetical protein